MQQLCTTEARTAEANVENSNSRLSLTYEAFKIIRVLHVTDDPTGPLQPPSVRENDPTGNHKE
jgi:hypothetical protein